MANIQVGDLVRLTRGRGARGGNYEVVQIYGDNLSLKREHVIIHNVHFDDIAPVGAKSEPVPA